MKRVMKLDPSTTQAQCIPDSLFPRFITIYSIPRAGGKQVFIFKFQITNPKFQTNPKYKFPMIQTVLFEISNFVNSDLFVIWPACAKSRHAGRRQGLGIWCLSPQDSLLQILQTPENELSHPFTGSIEVEGLDPQSPGDEVIKIVVITHIDNLLRIHVEDITALLIELGRLLHDVKVGGG